MWPSVEPLSVSLPYEMPKIVAHFHIIQVEQWISYQLAWPVICYLPSPFRNVKVGADMLDLLFFRVESIGIGRVVSSTGRIGRNVLCYHQLGPDQSLDTSDIGSHLMVLGL